MSSAFPLDAVALTKELVQLDSRNPSLVAGAAGEEACASFLASVLRSWGFAVSLDEIAPTRFNVIARIGPAGRTPLLLNGHLDVTGTDGMTHEPFAATCIDGKLYARGATDMKAGVAAMCVAAARAAARGALASEIIIAAVCDEEFESLGTRALIERGLNATAAIVTEPTRLAICPAHKGFSWIKIEVAGRAAHGSRYDIGIDANRNAALLVAALDAYDKSVLSLRHHELVGRSSLHIAQINGGSGWSTFSDSCVIHLERRTIPGESANDTLADVVRICSELEETIHGFQARVSLVAAQPPLNVSDTSEIVAAVKQSVAMHNISATIEGLSCWTDAALLAEAGIPAVCFGPGDIARAHAATEWVELQEIELACAILESACSSWGRKP